MAYDAFISYSHAADGKLAPSLQAGLQAFARPWNRLRAIRVFRDKTGLTVTPGLWSAVAGALNSSQYFLLLASPGAAQSHWVGKEVAHWLIDRPATRILLAVTDGHIAWNREANDFDWSTTTALPEALRARFSEEPLWVDLRWAKSEEDLSLQNPRFRDAVADLSSTVRGIPKDQLIGEDVRQHRKSVLFRRSALSGLGALAVALAVAMALALEQRNLARTNEAAARLQAQRALARQLAAQSAFVRNRRAELPRAALLAAEAVRRFPEDADVYQAALDVLALLPRQRRELNLGGAVDRAMFGPGAGSLLVSRKDTAEVWDLRSGKKTASVRLPDDIDAMAFSADGRRFAVAEHCHVIVHDALNGTRLGEARLNEQVKPFSGPGCIAFEAMDISPDGRLVAAGGDALVTRVWSIDTGAVVDLRHQHSAPASRVHAVTFSPDGSRLASVRAGDVALWTTADWQPIDTPDPPPRSAGEALAFSGRRGLYLGAVTGYGLATWTTDRGQRTRAMPLAGDNFTTDVAIAFNNDVPADMHAVFEASMVAASSGNEAVVWNLEDGRLASGREMARLHHQAAIRSLTFSPDSKLLLTVSEDGTAGVWELSSGVELARLVHASALRAGAFGEGGVWTVDAAGHAREWDVSDQAQSPVASGTPISFSADGSFIAVRQEFATEIIETRPAAGAKPRRFSGQYYATWDRAAGSYLEAHYAETGVEVRDLLKGTRVMFVNNRDIDPAVDSVSFTHGIDGVFFNRGGTHLAIHGPFYADVWHLATGRKLNAGGDEKLLDVIFSPDGARVAGRLPDGPIRVADLTSGQPVTIIPSKDQERNIRLAFSPDGRYLARMDWPLRVWDTRAASHDTPAYASDDGRLEGEAFTSDSAYFIGIEDRNNVIIRELATGRTVRVPGDHFARVEPSPTSSIVAIGAGNIVRLVDARTGRDVAKVDQEKVWSLAFSEDGKHLATGGSDGLLRIWETASWREVARVRHKGAVRTIRFSLDGRFAVAGVTETAGSETVTSFISHVRPEDPRGALCGRVTRNLTPDEWSQHLQGEPYEKTCPDIKPSS